MKTLIFLVGFLISFNFTAQEVKNLNFIISVDESIVGGNIYNTQIIIYKESGNSERVKTNYYPGNLSLNEVDYREILSEDTKSFALSFNYSEYCNTDEHHYDYEIELKKEWFEHYFFILKVYNTNKKKYKKIFDAIEGKEFTYEYYYPGGQMLRLTKRKKNGCFE